MSFLSQNYKVLPLRDAVKEFRRTGDSRIVSVTFDDGFDDLYFNVFPILKKYNIRPTIFITTGLIGTNETLWSEKVVYALKSSIDKELISVFFNNAESVRITDNNLNELIAHYLNILKKASEPRRIEILEDLSLNLDRDIHITSPESRMLTWEMVREMSDWGVEFGSHSVKHSVLSNLNDEEMRQELLGSKDKIEKELGRECQVFAYPVGGVNSFNEKVIEATKQAGYQMACTYLSGVVYHSESSEFLLRRLHIDSSVTMRWFKGILSFPHIFASNFNVMK
jgi:peptidoglycan/xylan/chitin deacetylase (PgdA/CDA1 family)